MPGGPGPCRVIVSALFPVAAVSIGLYAFSSAWMAVGLYHLGLLLAHAARGSVRTPISRLAAGGGFRVLAAGGLLGVGGGVLFQVVSPGLGLPPDLGERLAELGLGGWRWTAFVGYHVLVNPGLEELYWRGDLADPSSRPRPVDAAFALYHLVVIAPFVSAGWLPVAFGVLAGAAWIWRRMTRAAGGLRPALLSHLVADASILLAVGSGAGGR